MPWSPGSSGDALVSLTDYTDWFQLGTLTTDEQDRVVMAIDMASDAVRAYTGQMITPVAETITLAAADATTLILPQGPVTALTTVTRDGETLDVTSYHWDGRLVTLIDGSWWHASQTITVTYTHGYAVTPRDLAGVVLSKAKRLLDDPSGRPVQSETLGAWSVTYTALGNEGAFTAEEQEILDRYTAWTLAY